MRFLIVGSYASRDAFNGPLSRLKVSDYVTRVSFGSLMRGLRIPLVRTDFGPEKAESPDMRAAIEMDLSGSFESTLDARLAKCDVVMVDFFQERFPLLFHQGHLLTFSTSLQSGSTPKDSKLIQYNTPEYFEYWEVGFSRFVRHAKFMGKQVMINTCLWAENAGGGKPFDLKHVQRSNAILRKMHDRARMMGCRMIDYGDHEFVADPNHKLGPAPFHLAKASETILAAQVIRASCGI